MHQPKIGGGMDLDLHGIIVNFLLWVAAKQVERMIRTCFL
jgi:hypothetical protein